MSITITRALLALLVTGPTVADSSKPSTEVSPEQWYQAGADNTSPDYRQAATIHLSSEAHSGEATGAGSYMVRGVIEQNVIFHIMKTALEL